MNEDTTRQEQELELEREALLRALIQVSPLIQPKRVEPLELDQIVRYLSGALDPGQAHLAEVALTQDASARKSLVPILDCLDALKALPWEEVSRLAERSDLQGRVAREWSILITEEAETPTSESALQQSWKALQERVASGAAGVQRIQNRLLGFAEQFRASQRAFRIAYARGDEGQAAFSGELPSSVQAQVRLAEVTAEGALQAVLQLTSATPDALEGMIGVTVWLCLESGGFAWAVESREFKGEPLAWIIPGVGAFLELPAGALAQSQLRFHFGSLDELPVQKRYVYYADAESAEGLGMEPNAVPVTLTEKPRIEGDLLLLTLSMRPADQVEYANYQLVVELWGGPNLTQTLGALSMQDWEEEAQTFTLPCADFAEGALAEPGLLRFRLTPDSSL